MGEEIRIWQVSENDHLSEINRQKLDLEDRLEQWLVEDISILSSSFLIIGSQVETDYGKYIDLLCIDSNGDLVVVELKRHKTSREVTAQALDYASWVKELTHERIVNLANVYFAKKSTNFEKAFQQKFGIEIPEILNDSHAMLIVASEIDESTERIIRYLSGSFGVNINVAQFQYFKKQNGEEFVARFFLIEQSEVEQKAISKGGSKRAPNPSLQELKEIAVNNNVGDRYAKLIAGLDGKFTISTGRTILRFTGNINNTSKAIFGLVPEKSNSSDGVYFQIYLARFSTYTGLTEETVLSILPNKKSPWKYYESADDEYSGFEGYFESDSEVEKFLNGIQNIVRH